VYASRLKVTRFALYQARMRQLSTDSILKRVSIKVLSNENDKLDNTGDDRFRLIAGK